MNALEHYIQDIVEVKDISEEFSQCMKSYDPTFQLKEPFLSVTLIVDCYGVEGPMTCNWYQSNWNQIKEQGYFLA